jgi:hypothetical protein
MTCVPVFLFEKTMATTTMRKAGWRRKKNGKASQENVAGFSGFKTVKVSFVPLRWLVITTAASSTWVQ